MTTLIKTLRTRFYRFQQKSREPGLTVLVIVQATLIFLIIPLASMGVIPEIVLPVMFALLVIVILVVTSRTHLAAFAVLISVALSPFGAYVHSESPSVLTQWLSAGGRLLALAALSIVIARAVFAGGRVTFHRIQGAVVLYMNFGLIFFTIYRLIDVLLPNAFNGLPSSGAENRSGAALLYFSFSTLTTLGYGDITPIHPLARSIANLEAGIGQLYPATLLARLVSLHIEHRRHSRTD